MARPYNLHLFSAMQGSLWRIIASTHGSSLEGCELDRHLCLCQSEAEFAELSLYEDVSRPLIIMGKRGDKSVPIMIFRRAIFESMICLALEPTSYDEGVFDELYASSCGILASPMSIPLVEGAIERRLDPMSHFDIVRAVRDILAFEGAMACGGTTDPTELIDCINGFIDADIKPFLNVSQYSALSSGRIFARGFFENTVLAFAMACGSGRSDGDLEMSVNISDGYHIFSISFTRPRNNGWIGGEIIAEMADRLGIPFELRCDGGRISCQFIPEYVDEALEGVKVNRLDYYEFINS